MNHQFALRPARPEDYEFCRRLYFEGMGWIIEKLNLDVARQNENFARQWQQAEVRIITVGGANVGWLQATPMADAIMLGQLFLDAPFRRQGTGQAVMQVLFDEAKCANKAVTLSVVKINPARRFYERLGFRVTHQDRHKVWLRREPGP